VDDTISGTHTEALSTLSLPNRGGHVNAWLTGLSVAEQPFGRCRTRERPAITTAGSAGFGGSVAVYDCYGLLRVRPGAPVGSIRALKRQAAHGWIPGPDSVRAWVVWVRV
jgi:hypothetical protein